MKKTDIPLVATLLVLFMALAGASLLLAAGSGTKILVVHSYHEDQQEHVVPMTQGIIEALRQVPAEIRYFHMDAKRNTSETWKAQAGSRAKEMVDTFKPTVVITMDDIAQKYVASSYAGAEAPPYFVFGGVNGDPEEYGFPAANVTGVLERPNIVESLELLLKLVPNVKNLLILAETSETADRFIDYSQRLSLPVTVVAYEQPMTLADWKDTLNRYHDTVDAIGLYVVRTIARGATDSEKVPEQELIDHINTTYRIPTVGFFDSAAESGILCGISVSMFEQGYAAGQIAKEIIVNGKKPRDFLIKPTDYGRIQLNLLTAERLGIEIPYALIQRADIVVK